jgi:hypothetical protein
MILDEPEYIILNKLKKEKKIYTIILQLEIYFIFFLLIFYYKYFL